MSETVIAAPDAHSAASSGPPSWYTAAMAVPAEDGSVEVEGARIHYRAWGEPGAPGAVLVHGTAAHARWWDHIAPLLPAGMRYAAISISGHGGSDWRERYSLDYWAQEVLAVAAAAGIAGPPFIIGHSLGGSIAMRAREMYGGRLAGIIVIDTPNYDAPPPPGDPGAGGFGGTRTYSSREAALARYRLVPEQPVLPYVRKHVAAWSVHQLAGGAWGWKFDRTIFAKMIRFRSPAVSDGCRTALVLAENGLVTPEMAQRNRAALGPEVLEFQIPAAGHHVLLDEPLALVTALRAILAMWTHPDPDSSSSKE